jgi:hypothetical protein
MSELSCNAGARRMLRLSLVELGRSVILRGMTLRAARRQPMRVAGGN